MAPTPFEHGLALAWSDGALSRDGAIMLETLQKQLGISDKERSVQEQTWLSEISKSGRRSFGDGDQILREWLEGLNDRESLAPIARSMGRASLDVGLSKSGWKEAFQFAEGLGLGEDLASGVWLEKEAETLGQWPAALDPLAIILGLVISVPKVVEQQNTELVDGTAFVLIDHPDAKPTHLSWMPDLIPVNNEICAWGWTGDRDVSTSAPQNDFVYCNSVLIAWIRRLIAMRHQRGESGLEGLPEGFQVMPSSCELSRDGTNLKLSMIVDLGENGLVRPWASVNIDKTVEINPAPEGLGPNWVNIHDGLANLILTALDTLPRQLLQASGLQTDYSNISVQDGWITHDLG
tara:strand:- start:4417 stop:5463 length:1047 start_codon:yes stop_codon:yes gene_type:complete